SSPATPAPATEAAVSWGHVPHGVAHTRVNDAAPLFWRDIGSVAVLRGHTVGTSGLKETWATTQETRGTQAEKK
ncbi:unnamed protein product, partial [Ectocarpus sp. 12 AP-2014]